MYCVKWLQSWVLRNRTGLCRHSLWKPFCRWTHCNTLQHTATHRSTLQYTVAHCSTLHRTAPHCNTCVSRHSLRTPSAREYRPSWNWGSSLGGSPCALSLYAVVFQNRKKFSKVSSLLSVRCKMNTQITFEKLCLLCGNSAVSMLAVRGGHYDFSKVSSLLNVQCKMNTQTTFWEIGLALLEKRCEYASMLAVRGGLWKKKKILRSQLAPKCTV